MSTRRTSVRSSLSALRPRFEVGRISGSTLTMGQPGDGWYVAIQWLGRVYMFETLRAINAAADAGRPA